MFNRTVYEVWVEKYGLEEANRREEKRIEKIKSHKPIEIQNECVIDLKTYEGF